MMGEHIADSFKAEAMGVPYLAELLRSDSIYIASNITFDNLAPLSMYLGKPGDPAKGGLPFDEYMRGDDDALTEQQKDGLDLFVGKANCVACHTGPLLSNEAYYNIGVPPSDGWETDELAQITFRFELLAKGVTEDMYRTTKDDPGLYFRTKQKSDKGKFRVPSLRYTAYTYPYMHNGMLETLRDVVEFYNAGGGENEFSENKSDLIQPLGLEDGEVDALVAFLESLSGEELLIEEPEIPFMEPLPVAQN